MKSSSVVLKKGKERFFTSRHPWIFSGAIASFPDQFEQGKIFPVKSSYGELLGYAYFHQKMSLSGRVVSFGAEDPYDAIKKNIDHACRLRQELLQKGTNAFRLINGEGDLLPGLIVDQYDKSLVVQSGTLGMDHLLEFVCEILSNQGRYTAIYEKSTGGSRKEEGLNERVEVLYGSDQLEIAVLENHFKFIVDWRRGQKTGFFLDQRSMREVVMKHSLNRRVLNAFCYTGGFSVYALAGGAEIVDSIDISERATEMTQRHLAINGFQKEKNRTICEDVFEFLSQGELNYNFVILDPPAFAKKKKDIPKAIAGYRMINQRAMEKMPSQSLLLTCSCSYYVNEEKFREMLFQAAREAKRGVKIVGRHISGMDHPSNLFHPEGDYLKSYLLYLD